MHSLAKISWTERLQFLKNRHNLSDDDIHVLQNNICTDFKFADSFIENAFSYFAIPIGVVPCFIVNETEYTVPIATEEASVVAGLIHANMYIKRHKGSITSTNISKNKIGQIQIPIVSDINILRKYIATNKTELMSQANDGPSKNMFKRGGGVKDLYLRELMRPDGCIMGIIYIVVDTIDAMGANTVNQICEFIKKIICLKTNEKLNVAILSNLNNDIVETEVSILGVKEELGCKIQEASLFAQLDIHRASTNNKGIMNGIDGLLIATGNDFRAVEASMHAYAARQGNYRGLSTWIYNDGVLTGKLQAPISVGIVGGITRSHPIANICLKILGITRATELSELAGAVGLIQNFSALKALCTDGIVRGHMNLYLKNLLMDQNSDQRDIALKQARAKLTQLGFINSTDL